MVWDSRSHPEAAKSDSTADREPSLQYANYFFFYCCEELLVITFYSWYLGYNSSSVIVPLSKIKCCYKYFIVDQTLIIVVMKHLCFMHCNIVLLGFYKAVLYLCLDSYRWAVWRFVSCRKFLSFGFLLSSALSSGHLQQQHWPQQSRRVCQLSARVRPHSHAVVANAFRNIRNCFCFRSVVQILNFLICAKYSQFLLFRVQQHLTLRPLFLWVLLHRGLSLTCPKRSRGRSLCIRGGIKGRTMSPGHFSVGRRQNTHLK